MAALTDVVVLDSNALTDLVESLRPDYDPSQDDPVLAANRVAATRLYLYIRGGLRLLPTACREYRQIRDSERLRAHDFTALVGVPEVQAHDLGDVTDRTETLGQHHSGRDDCRALAEAEAFGADVLLTRDKALCRRLQDKTTVTLASPRKYWAALGVPRGTPPERHFVDEGQRLYGWWDW